MTRTINASSYRRYGKRLIDASLAAIGLVTLAPLLLLLAALVRTRLGGPVLFRQQRAGRDGRPFRLIKFRTMNDVRDPGGELLPDAARMPPFGRWLRSTSLDELPELWNVLRGDMSLVGPRPLLLDYLPRYSQEQARRHEVRPGLTGWAQVEGRNATNWATRLRHDVWYVDHLGPGLDLRILMRTVACVLSREGISAEGHATMPAFTGEAGTDGEDAARLSRAA